MALDTYANLKTSITAWTKRADLSSYLSEFVTLAEARIFTDLKVKEMEARTEYTPTSRYLATPTQGRVLRWIFLALLYLAGVFLWAKRLAGDAPRWIFLTGLSLTSQGSILCVTH